MQNHRHLLTWLIYAVVVVLVATGLLYLGVPQTALQHDHSYLTVVLLGLYGVAEFAAGRAAWGLSREHRNAIALRDWLRSHPNDGIAVTDSDMSFGDTVVPASSETYRHVTGLYLMAQTEHRVDQSLLLDVLSERLHGRIAAVEFMAGRAVWIGILATILGVILAFWPMMAAGMTVETMRGNLATFFAGIAVAFIPTAASFVIKIALDCSTRILNSAAGEITTELAHLGETVLLPALAEDLYADANGTDDYEAAA